MERTKRRWTGRALAVAAIGLMIGVSVVLAVASVGAYRTEIEDQYRSEAELMAATYARAVGRWWLRDDVEMMAEAARLMIVGSALFVQVTVGEETLLDQRDPGFGDEPAIAAHGAAQGATSHVGQTASGMRYLDTIAPIFLSEVEQPIGRVRIGFGLTSVTRQARARTWGTVGIVTACDAAGIGAIVALFVLRRRRRSPVVREVPATEDALVRGDLKIDPVSKTVTVRGEPVDLTPKQFQLLRLLAEVPGCVLSDADILAAVWPESPYADSRDVKQCVYTLRRRLGRVVDAPGDVVVNITGYGYKLVPPENGEGLRRA